jgi:drug/metabolite transporter (DMT)-like permease
VVFARVSIAAAVLWLVIALSGQRPTVTFGLSLAFVAMGALNNVIPFTLIVWGQTRIGSGLASILNATTPLFTVIFAHWLTRDERLTPARLVGVVFGLLGVLVMIGPRALEHFGLEVVAQLAVVGAAISYAFAGIFGRRFQGTPPLVTAAGQLSASALMMLPLVMVVDRPLSLDAPTMETWGAVFGLSLLSTAVAYVIYFRILARAGATNLLLVTFLLPVSALLLAITLLGETLEIRQVTGMFLIGSGLAAIDGRPMAAGPAFIGRRRRDASAPVLATRDRF